MRNPGQFNTAVSFLRPIDSANQTTMGEIIRSNFDFAFSRFCMVLHMGGEELVEAKKVNAEVSVKIVTWFDDLTSVVDAKWVLQVVTKQYPIKWIKPLPGGAQSQFVEFYCKGED